MIKSIKNMSFPWQTQDPFLFCVHHEDFYPEGNEKMEVTQSLDGRNIGNDFTIKDGFRMYHGEKVPGFPAHPHRGFETVTVVRTGLIDHSDSMGAAGRFGNGDVQWMTAGKGVQHSEMFPLLKSDKDNPLELFQIWLNLPKVDKMVDPHFKMLWSEDTPVYKNNGVEVEIFAGTLNGLKAVSPTPNSWASKKENHVAVWHIKLDPNAKFTIPKVEAGISRSLYLFKGPNVEIAEQKINNYQSADLESDQDIEIQNGTEESFLLLLQGRPIGEPVVQYGPFVMNTQGEIREAFIDYQENQFGGWPWPRPDNVHKRESGRFALHADGTMEIKE